MSAMGSVWDIDRALEAYASMPISRFYPTAVAKVTGVPLDVVFTRLLKAVEDKKLVLEWEIRCPEYGCFHSIAYCPSPPDLDTSWHCRCGNDLEVTYDYIYPVFSFSPEYREDVNSKKKEYPLDVLRQGLRAPGANANNPSLYNPEVADLLNRIHPNSQFTIMIQNVIGGGPQGVTQSNINISNVSGSNVAVGNNNNQSQSTSTQIQDTTNNLIQEIERSNLVDKTELVEMVKEIVEKSKEPSKNRLTILSLINTLSDTISATAKVAPLLMPALAAWKTSLGL